MNAVIAGRFDSALVIAVARELAGHLSEPPALGAGIAYCYGNRLEMAKVDFKNPSWPDGIAELKTDLALICLNQPGQDRPLLHRGRSRSWSLDITGPVPQLPADVPSPATASWTRPSFSNRPEDRFFAHLVECFDPHDPVGSIEACRVKDSSPPRFFFLAPDALVLDSGSVPEPELLFGRAQMVRVVSPVRLESVIGAEWEPVSPLTVLALTRFRHSLA